MAAGGSLVIALEAGSITETPCVRSLREALFSSRVLRGWSSGLQFITYVVSNPQSGWVGSEMEAQTAPVAAMSALSPSLLL